MPPLHIFSGVLLLSLHAASCFAANDTLVAGQALAVGDKLVSSNGKFALGFFQPSSSKSSNISSPSWYLGIWFNKIPIFTPVWVANREKPIPDPELNLTRLKLSGDGNLVLLNHATETIIWSTETVNSTNTTSATLLDDGNLVIQSLAKVLWQSFDYPADVFLPGAKIGWNKLTGFSRQFTSKKSLIDPGLGSYCIELDTSGAKGLILKHCSLSVVYWSSPPGKLLVGLLNAVVSMDNRTRGLINASYVDNNEEAYYTYTLLDESSYTFALLDTSGQIKMNVWSQARQSWQSIYAQPVDPCTPYATCGPFAVCNGISYPFCDCMEGFSVKSPRDWNLDDRTSGCVRSTPIDCGSKENTTSSSDTFHPIARVTLPYQPQIVQDATTQSKCEEACLNNCSCTAYSFNNNKCSVWHGELLSVNKNDGIDNTSEDVLYLRLSTKDLPGSSKNKRTPVVVLVTIISIVCFGILVLLLVLVLWKNRYKWCGAPLHDTQGSAGIIPFRYSDLGHATKNFSEKLGVGGFGSVFKGVLGNSTPIAVKRLDGARQGEKQFRAEVSSIGLIQHINLVKLIGFCCEGDYRLLVYEHMLNGSLDAHLFKTNAMVLNWSTRYQIAIGVARGLCYLHESCRECIIHCDIKPENILLDALFHPKIADFGMAAFVGRDFSRVLTTFRGTIGYLAPEWISGVAITQKIDVYSFGMVLFELISGRRNSPEVDASSSHHVSYFPMRAIRNLYDGDVRSLVDPQLRGDFNMEQAERVCKVACWCIQDDEHVRPTMSEVVRVLEGLLEVEMPPVPRLLAAMTECPDSVSMTENDS